MAKQVIYRDVVDTSRLVKGAVVMVRDKHDGCWVDIGLYEGQLDNGQFDIKHSSGEICQWHYCEPLHLDKFFTQRFEEVGVWQPCS